MGLYERGGIGLVQGEWDVEVVAGYNVRGERVVVAKVVARRVCKCQVLRGDNVVAGRGRGRGGGTREWRFEIRLQDMLRRRIGQRGDGHGDSDMWVG